MAIISSRLPALLLLSFTLLAATASSRPCKTLFYFSTTTYYHPSNPNSVDSINYPQIHQSTPRYFTLVFTGTSRFQNIRPTFDEQSRSSSSSSVSSSSSSGSNFPSNLFSSVMIKDIMTVLGALLFGVGCGAITAAVMYFIWALFSARRVDFDDVASSSSDDDDDDDDIAAIKRKFGYIAVPEAVDDLKKPAPPAKDMV